MRISESGLRTCPMKKLGISVIKTGFGITVCQSESFSFFLVCQNKMDMAKHRFECRVDQCFSTARSPPGTGPWHQLYRAERDFPGVDN